MLLENIDIILILLTYMATIQTTDNKFGKDVLESNIPVIVDFWAEWGGPCKQIGPILEEISEEKKDVIKIFKLNIDENSEITQKYGIRGIPTLMLFKEGKLIDTKVGSLGKQNLNDWIDGFLV